MVDSVCPVLVCCQPMRKPSAKGKSKPRKPVKGARKVVSKSTPRKTRKIKPTPFFTSSKAIQAQLEKQRLERKEAVARGKGERVLRRLRVRKADRGTIVFVETTGKRDTAKGRKGYLVLIGKRGKKTLLKDPKKGFTPQQKTKLVAPFTKQTAPLIEKLIDENATKQVLGKGQIKSAGRVNDFSDKMVDGLARGITKTINAQTGFRDFTLRAMVLVKVPGMGNKVYDVAARVQKPQGVKIPAAHMEGFLRKEFWLILSRQLAFDGYVTNGSANHVRMMAENKGKDQAEWTKGGIPWESRHDTQRVSLKQIDWQMIQNRELPKKKRKRKKP